MSECMETYRNPSEKRKMIGLYLYMHLFIYEIGLVMTKHEACDIYNASDMYVGMHVGIVSCHCHI